MTRVFLVRHGESAWNAEGRLQGQADPELSDAGREQARSLQAVVGQLPHRRLVASDLVRARETAAIAGFPDAPLDPRWRERTLGEWETHLEAEVATKDDMAAFRRGDLVPPGAESWPAFQARVAGALDELDEDALVFTHGGCVRAAVAHLTGADWRTVAGPGNASLTVVQTGARPRVLAFNWTRQSPGLARPSDPGA